MKKVRLKYQFVPILFGLLLIPIFTIIIASKENFQPSLDPSYINENEEEETIKPVINDTKKIINPYIDANVKIGRDYYEFQADEESQLNSITVHENTYLQNNGIDFVCENQFDVLAVLEGTVITVKDDETVGKIIEIKHEDNYITTYQSLSEVEVKKGDLVSQGQVIGKSGTNELDKELGNHIHFEVYSNGQSINPKEYLNKKINTKKDN